MKNFGLSMEKNINYELGKRILNKALKNTTALYQWLKESCEKYENTLFELPELTGFNYEKAVKFIRTWDIVEELPADKKNLFVIFWSTGFNYKKTLEIFNGVGKGCKNVATLRVLVSNIRKIIKEQYKEKYGTDTFDFNSGNSDIYC